MKFFLDSTKVHSERFFAIRERLVNALLKLFLNGLVSVRGEDSQKVLRLDILSLLNI